MRLWLLMLSVSMLVFAPLAARAGSSTDDYLKLLDQVDQNRKLFGMAVDSCFREIYARDNVDSDDTGVVEKCIADKGIDLHKRSVEDSTNGPRVYQMGRGATDPTVYTYQIPEKNALLRQLGQPVPSAAPGTAPQDAPPQAPAGQDDSGNPSGENAQQSGTSSRKGSSAQPKYYLRSESGEGPKPIFLNR